MVTSAAKSIIIVHNLKSIYEEVWGYHQRLIAAIESKDVQLSQQLLNEHFDLLMDRLVSR